MLSRGWLLLGLMVFVAGPFAGVQNADPRIPAEVRFKTGYVNPAPKPAEFSSVMLWGIAIADTRAPGYESATVEVESVRLSCRADGKDVVLINASGRIHGGLYRRIPWFQGNQPEPMPLVNDAANNAVVLAVGKRGDRIWHFWSASPRPALPRGKLEGCTVQANVQISPGALLQMGMDYWRDPTVPFGSGGNNREAGASNWYFPSDQWQEAVFSDINHP